MAVKALMILGPTASGKTALSLALARRLPVEIISVDSALVYRGMDIGSAKPTREELSVCPHHLIDIREISEPYSAADFRDDARRLIPEIRTRGHFPLIVGGTMLYARALRRGIDEMPATDPALRDQVAQEGMQKGWPALHQELTQVDPQAAARIQPNDSQRIARALEVWRSTGRPLSSFQQGNRPADPEIAVIGLVPGDRARLHALIGERFDAMVAAGLEAEVRGLMARSDFSRDLPSMRCVGYRQAIDYLLGECTREEFIAAGKAATRQLAKRQMTWLRPLTDIEVLDPYALSVEELLSHALRRIDPAA